MFKSSTISSSDIFGGTLTYVTEATSAIISSASNSTLAYIGTKKYEWGDLIAFEDKDCCKTVALSFQGAKKEDISVSVHSHYVSISASIKIYDTDLSSTNNYYYDGNYDLKSAEVSLVDGILYLTVKKIKPIKVEIK